jgi:hypothetical protein
MKMKKINQIIYMSVLATVALSGCKKFLEHQPDDRSELNTPVKVAELLANAYPHGNYIPFAEAMSDNAGDKGNRSGNAIDITNESPWKYEDQVDAQLADTPPYYWNACYKAISAANYALEAIEKGGDTEAYKASKGEALVARAYSHFMLVTFFSKAYDPATAASDPGIPYVTAPQKTVEGSYRRGTVAEVYAQIEKDLEEGIPLIRNNTYRVPKYHFTTQAAHAFATRFYLFKRDYLKVVDHANAVFPGATVAAGLRPWNTTYNALGYYELQALYTNSSEPANLLIQESATSWGTSYAEYNYSLSSEVQKIFNPANNPIKRALAISSKVFGGTEFFLNIPKFRNHIVKETINASFGEFYNMIPLLTAEEVLFNRAEANVMLGNNAAAVTDMDAYLSKRIVNYSATAMKFTEAKAMAFFPGMDVKDALVGSILNFKRQEYMHEGIRWFDIIRLKIPITHPYISGGEVITLGANDPRRVIQLPQEAIALGLEKNAR